MIHAVLVHFFVARRRGHTRWPRDWSSDVCSSDLMMMTAAGTIPPAKVLVLGAGVAGLQAIATAKRLGAVVEAFDVRPVVKEQVESLGATFVEVEMEEEETE